MWPEAGGVFSQEGVHLLSCADTSLTFLSLKPVLSPRPSHCVCRVGAGRSHLEGWRRGVWRGSSQLVRLPHEALRAEIKEIHD